jgi:ABC-type nitrate/sulfonate/bicarbonate transport system substrate-binding protein
VVPQEGGIKDLTAMGLLKELGWEHAETIRQPSGDGAILSFVGQGADAASMVEPYATMLTELGMGRVVKRTGDLWPGAPGCSLTTTAHLIEAAPQTVQAVVTAFVKGARFAEERPDEAAHMAERYIGVSERFIRAALSHNAPKTTALENRAAMDAVIELMLKLDYLKKRPTDYINLSFLARARELLG